MQKEQQKQPKKLSLKERLRQMQTEEMPIEYDYGIGFYTSPKKVLS